MKQDQPEMPDELTSELSSLLSNNPNWLPETAPKILEIMQGYETDLDIAQTAGHPKQRKRQVAKLLRVWLLAAEEMRDLPAEYAVAIETLAEGELKCPTSNFVQLVADLFAFAAGAERFLASFDPPKGRPTNFALESAIRDLVELFGSQYGLPITIKWNKLKEVGPEPESEAARAIVAILRSAPSPPTEVAILNMIQKVIADPEGEPPSPFDPVIRAHFDELDAYF